MNSILRESAEKTFLVVITTQRKQYDVQHQFQTDLGLTADSSIAKWGIEGSNDDMIENFGLKLLEKGHQDAQKSKAT